MDEGRSQDGGEYTTVKRSVCSHGVQAGFSFIGLQDMPCRQDGFSSGAAEPYDRLRLSEGIAMKSRFRFCSALTLALALLIGGCEVMPTGGYYGGGSPYYGNYPGYGRYGRPGYGYSNYGRHYPAPYAGYSYGGYRGYGGGRQHEHRPPPPAQVQAAPTLSPRQQLNRVERKLDRNEVRQQQDLAQNQRREIRRLDQVENRFNGIIERRTRNLERRGASEDAVRAMQQQWRERQQQREQQVQARFQARDERLRQQHGAEAARLEARAQRLEQRAAQQAPGGFGGGQGGQGRRHRQHEGR
jgi:hypothetical protein